MKRILPTSLLILSLFVFTGCAQKDATNTPAASGALAASEEIFQIKEKMFIAQTNDIYFNPDDYLGKTIQLEGMFKAEVYAPSNQTYYSVIRYGPGCCGVDANAGFEVEWDQSYPNVNDWVEATGVLEQYEEDGDTYLRLRLSALNVLQKRGLEVVTQ